ncbi:MAG: stage III sporulation protein AC [Clostridia bacterium]|nr:stage III sporulation protein AC [Clostridia bacterium]
MDLTIIYKISLIGVVCAIASILLKKSGKEEIGTLVSLAGINIAVVLVLDMVAQLFDTIKSLFDFY